MKTRHTKNVVNSELAVFKIEEVIKFTRPDIYNNRYCEFDDATYDTILSEVRAAIKSLDKKKLMPEYKLLDLATSKKQASSILAKALIDIDYYDEISSTEYVGVIRKIIENTKYRSITYTNSKKRLNDIYQNRLSATNDILTIESILAECSTLCDAYIYGLDILIPHYKTKIDKFHSKFDIEKYLNHIENERGIDFDYSKNGIDFLTYCNKKSCEFEISECKKPKEVLKIRKNIFDRDLFNIDRDLVALCDEKISNLIADIGYDNLSNDEVIGTYCYIPSADKKSSLLATWLKQDRDESDARFYWHIYWLLMMNFPESDTEITLVKDKLIQAFYAITSKDDSFQAVYGFFEESYATYVGKFCQILTNDSIILETIIERIGKGTIPEIGNCISSFSHCRNATINKALVQGYFKLNPTIVDMLYLESRLLELQSDLIEFSELLELFYNKVNYTVIQRSFANQIIISEMESYFAITKSPVCLEAKKLLTQNQAK